jgi:hypothetical protein
MDDLVTIDDLPTISPQEIHRNNLKAFAIGNRAHHVLIAGITALEDMGGWDVLGSTSASEYGETYFKFRKSMTHECMQAARKLRVLPALTAQLRNGLMCWSAVSAISRVAKPGKEEKWIAFAQGKSVRAIEVEVREAIEKKRDEPREVEGYGLPAIRMRLPFSFSPEEYTIFEKAIEKYRGEVVARLGKEEDLGPKKMLLGMAQLFLETDPSGLPAGRAPGKTAPYHVVYHFDLSSGRAYLLTEEGPVEVPAERVAVIEGEAERAWIEPKDVMPAAADGAPARAEVPKDQAGAAAPKEKAAGSSRPALDRPNTRALVRKVRLLDGNRCAVPNCPHKEHLRAHHIIHREDGGRTEVWNEIMLCSWHHAITHAGYLRIEITPECGVRFIRKADGIRPTLDDDVREVRALPIVRVESTRVEKPGQAGLEDAAGLLRRLGFRGEVAEKRVRRAYEGLAKDGKTVPTSEEIVKAALDGV